MLRIKTQWQDIPSVAALTDAGGNEEDGDDFVMTFAKAMAMLVRQPLPVPNSLGSAGCNFVDSNNQVLLIAIYGWPLVL